MLRVGNGDLSSISQVKYLNELNMGGKTLYKALALRSQVKAMVV